MEGWVMSSGYSEQPEFGTDSYSYVIGQPLPKRDSHKPMESWSESRYHPSYGTTTVSLHNWERSYRSVSFGDYDEDGVYKLSTTFIDKESGVVEDVHGHYMLGGSLLEKVKRDFDRHVIGAWQTARSYHKEFPHHTIVKLSRVLDPAKDPQPKYMNTGAYIEVKDSDISGYSDMCLFSTSTPKGTSSFQGKIYYSFNGQVGRTESYITRNTYRDFAVKTFLGRIEYIYDSKYGVIQEMSKAERRRLMTEERRWEKRRIKEKKARETEARRRAAEAERAKRAAAAEEKKKQSDSINQHIIDHYEDCTQSEMARALGISTKAVEHRVSRLRKKGLVPLSKGSGVYRDKSEIEQEERQKLARKRKQSEERAAERKRRQDEGQNRRDAIAHEKKEREERVDRYIIDNYQAYDYGSIARQLGISKKALKDRIGRLRRQGRIPPIPAGKHYDPFDWQFDNSYSQDKRYDPPPFEG